MCLAPDCLTSRSMGWTIIILLQCCNVRVRLSVTNTETNVCSKEAYNHIRLSAITVMVDMAIRGCVHNSWHKSDTKIMKRDHLGFLVIFLPGWIALSV